MPGISTATWGIAALATFGVIVRPWNLPEYVWAVVGAALLVGLNLLPWPRCRYAVFCFQSPRILTALLRFSFSMVLRLASSA